MSRVSRALPHLSVEEVQQKIKTATSFRRQQKWLIVYNEVFDSLDKVMDTLYEGLNYFNSVPEKLKSMTYFPHLRITL